MDEIIKLWKDNKVSEVIMTFYCGGDNMGDTNFEVLDGNTNPISVPELVAYFDNAVYNNVEFYVNSDGHYMGENGSVVITLDEDEEPFFVYSKSSQSEWNESHINEVEVKLSDDMAKFVRENVSNINGGEGGIVVNYNRDFILSDKDEEIQEGLEDLITDTTSNYEPEHDGELDSWYTFTTNEDGEEIKLEGVMLTIQINNLVTTYRDE
jgi:hypothetical protein